MNIFINIAIYQLAWFLSVLWENSGALVAVFLLPLHLFLSPARRADGELMGLLLLAGVLIDGSLHYAGFIQFNVAAYPIPLWLGVIWLALATLPNHSLAWMKSRYIVSALFGAAGGPLAYWAGVKLEVATFTLPLAPSLLILALIWALLWPAVMYVAALRFNQLSTTHQTPLRR